MVWAIHDEKVTREHRKDVEDFQRLEEARASGRMGKAGRTKLFRIQKRLESLKIITLVTPESMRPAAANLYYSWPWYKRTWIKFKFHRRNFRSWCSAKWLEIKFRLEE